MSAGAPLQLCDGKGGEEKKKEKKRNRCVNQAVFICRSFVQATALFSAYPSRAFTMHAAADSAPLGFMFCVLSGPRIPPRNGGIVAADLAKSHTRRSYMGQWQAKCSKETAFTIQRQISKSNTLSLPKEIDVRKLSDKC